MTQTDPDSVALLRIGCVTAVRTNGVEITVDADKNEPSILYNGDIIDNVTIGKYVIIHRGYRKLVVRVEEEYLTEDRQWRDDDRRVCQEYSLPHAWSYHARCGSSHFD